MAQNVNLHTSDPRELISSAKLAELLQEVAPGETLRPEVEEVCVFGAVSTPLWACVDCRGTVANIFITLLSMCFLFVFLM